MTEQEAANVRLLIGASSFADAESAIRIAELMANKGSVEFRGVLVEETVLVDAAVVPSQKLVTATGSLVIAPTSRQLKSTLDSEALAFRNILSRLANSRAADWTFDRQRGELISTLFDAAKGFDLLFLGHRNLHPFRGRVLFIKPEKAGDQRAEILAHNLAERLGTDVLDLTLKGAANSPSGRVNPQYNFSSDQALFAAVGRMNADVVVVDPVAGPLRDSHQLGQLRDAARCPVIAVGMAR